MVTFELEQRADTKAVVKAPWQLKTIKVVTCLHSYGGFEPANGPSEATLYSEMSGHHSDYHRCCADERIDGL